MTDPFVSSLRTGPSAVRIGSQAGDTWPLRAQVAEMWDTVRLDVAPATPVGDVKKQALAFLAPAARAEDTVIKLNGWELTDETLPLKESGARPGSTFLIHFRRRRPVR